MMLNMKKTLTALLNNILKKNVVPLSADQHCHCCQKPGLSIVVVHPHNLQNTFKISCVYFSDTRDVKGMQRKNGQAFYNTFF